MRKILLCVLLAVCTLPAFAMKNYLSINMEAPFLFEVSELDDNSRTTLIPGMGISVRDRLFFDEIGINGHALFTLPFTAVTIAPEVLNTPCNFPSYIVAVGVGVSYRKKMFNLDIGGQVRLLALKNQSAEILNFTTGFYVSPSIGVSFSEFILDIGLTGGMDFYSNSATTLLRENNREVNYSGKYTLFYFGLYAGICFPSKNE